MKKWVFILLAITLGTLGATLAWWARSDPAALVYRGRPLSAWMQRAVEEGDPDAETVLRLAIAIEDAAAKARLGKELRKCVVHTLKTPDNRFWKPYNALKTKMPGLIGELFPQWREPKQIRESASYWVYSRSGAFDSPATVLTDCRRNDSARKIRLMISWALTSYGLTSPEDFPLMFPALTDPNPRIRWASLQWFSVTKVSPEAVVPILVAGCEDDAMRNDYAATLRGYGVQAMFMVPSLVELSRTNNRATASVASWALVGIDPDGAGRRFREEGMR